MMAYLLLPLGFSCVSAQITAAPAAAFSPVTVAPISVAPAATIAPGALNAVIPSQAPATVVKSLASSRMDACMTEYVRSTGEPISVVCAAFWKFYACYEEHISTCNRENGEALVYEKKYNKIVRRLPSVLQGGCRENAPHLVQRNDLSAWSDSSVIESSVIVLPGSGTDGNPSGFSIFYANWWQWLVLISCVCCCFLAAGGVCVSRRKRGNQGYYEDPYAQQQLPTYHDPQQVQPLTGYNQGYSQGNQGYTANMPTQFAMQGQGQYY